MKKITIFTLILFVSLLFAAVSPIVGDPAQAQTEDQIRLSVTKVIGYASGIGKAQQEMQGTFNITARGPANLERVVFYLDGEVFGEATQDPFRLQFTTDAYPLGAHTFTAVGFTSDGREIASDAVYGTFVTAGQGLQSGLRIIIPLFAVIFGLMGVSALITGLTGRNKKPLAAGAPRNYGALGGTICPKCLRPSAFGFFSPNMLIGKLQLCPHCRKWSIVRRVSIQELRAAEQLELEREQQAAEKAAPALSEEDRLRKELEASRYNE